MEIREQGADTPEDEWIKMLVVSRARGDRSRRLALKNARGDRADGEDPCGGIIARAASSLIE
jgi:hypothetical protein